MQSNHINQTFQNGKTLLMMMSAIDTSSEMVDYLLRQGADPRVVDQDGETALMYAAYHMNINAVAALIQYDVNLARYENSENSPLLSLILRYLEMPCSESALFKILYYLRVSDQQTLSRACFLAADRENLIYGSRKHKLSYQIARKLLEYGADANFQEEGVSMLSRAASVYDEEMSLLLISFGADPRYVYRWLNDNFHLDNNLHPHIKRLWKLFSCQRPAPALFGLENDQYQDTNASEYQNDVKQYLPAVFCYVERSVDQLLKEAAKMVSLVWQLSQWLAVSRNDLPYLPKELWLMIIQRIEIPFQLYPNSIQYILYPDKTKVIPLEAVCSIHPHLTEQFMCILNSKKGGCSVLGLESNQQVTREYLLIKQNQV